MITMTPLPLKELTTKAISTPCENTPDHGMDQDDKMDVRHGRSMEFKNLGVDPRTAFEPDRLYTEEDLVRAVDDARRATAIETEAEVRSVMAEEIEQRRCDMLAAIKDQLERHGAAFDKEIDRLAAVSHQLAIALAKAVIPRAIERQPLIDITDVLKVTLAGLTAAPAMELRLHPSLVESGEVMIADLVQDTGFAGEVTTVPDPALDEGDAELRWKNGAVSRRPSRLQAEALELAEHWLKDLSGFEGGEAHTLHSAPPELETSDSLSDQESDKENTMSERRDER